jgi:hypothetical protein
MIPGELEQLLRLIEDTGDHPDNGMHCPGRHRACWTVARVHVDACHAGQPGRGRHVAPTGQPVPWPHVWRAQQDAWALRARLGDALRARLGLGPAPRVRVITLSRVL